jgi:hypothetical protein
VHWRVEPCRDRNSECLRIRVEQAENWGELEELVGVEAVVRWRERTHVLR